MPSFSKSKAKFFQVSTLLEKNSFSFGNSEGAHAKKTVAIQKNAYLKKFSFNKLFTGCDNEKIIQFL